MEIGEWGIGACVTRQGMETCVDHDYERIEIVVNLKGLRDMVAALDAMDVLPDGGSIMFPLGRRRGRPCSLLVVYNPRVEPGEEVRP
jgi:hypothetical protein